MEGKILQGHGSLGVMGDPGIHQMPEIQGQAGYGSGHKSVSSLGAGRNFRQL